MKMIKVMKEGVYDPSIFKAIFLAGGPGSGKSFVQKYTVGGFGLKVINSDKAFEKMMRDAGLSLRMPDDEAEEKDIVRGRAKDLTNRIQRTYEEGRLGLIVDGTGGKVHKIERQKKELESLGYDTYMVFVNTSLDVALQRNELRDRRVPPEIVKSLWKGVQENFGAFQSMFGNLNFSIVDNNDMVLDPSNDPLFVNIYKKVREFVSMPPRNKIAKDWINNELVNKRRQ